jgi:outer membrane protein TolC
MKTAFVFCGVLFAAIAASAQETSAVDDIVQKRGALLERILEVTKNQVKAGSASYGQVRDATVKLYSFRRDIAKTNPERVQWQERIVAAEKESKDAAAKSLALGLASPIDPLLAEEQLLAAEQKLLELKSLK